jgi:purine-binding chemotaxis protein CheW
VADEADEVAESNERSLELTAEEVLRRRAVSLAREAAEVVADDQIGILLFRLDDEWYGVRVEDVREIYQEYAITYIPCTPEFISGVVNIRGEIISVTDIARLMQLGVVSTDEGNPPAIVIHNDACATAMVVDEIGDISEISADGIEPPLAVMDRLQAEYIAGSVYVDERLVGLLNVDRVLAPVGSSE